MLYALSLVLLLAAGWYAARNRLFDDWLLGGSPCSRSACSSSSSSGSRHHGPDRRHLGAGVFAAYLLTLPLVPVGRIHLAIKEKSRWSDGRLAIGAFGVFVMVARLQQIWDLHG